MRVQEVMRKSPRSCSLSSNLAAVTEQLWDYGCGALPVVDANGKVLGILTDRDICVAIGTRNRRPSELRAEDAMSLQIATCKPIDDIHDALKVMRTRKVRRLPVVNDQGRLEGILCLSDLVVNARHDDGSEPELSYEDVMGVLRSVYWLHLPPVVAAREGQ